VRFLEEYHMGTPISRPSLLPRGCGERKEGGIYAECGLSKWGLPVEHFLVDPPQVVEMDALGLTAIGVKLIEVNGVWHVFDVVGSEHYPNVADLVEEVRILGASRRLAKTLDFSRLTSESKLVLLHRRAQIENAGEYVSALGAWMPTGWHCPKHLPEHESPPLPPAMCAGLWWVDVEGGATPSQVGRHLTPSLCGVSDASLLTAVTRHMPSFSYDAWARPVGIQAQYRLAIFMVLPITNLAVIRAKDGSHEESRQAAERARLPVEVCDA
jgi:hypothetical protein